MPFQLEAVTEVAFTNANVRRELHGEEHVRAVDITMKMRGENTLLDLIEKGLREHHYCNRALQAGQESLPDVLVPMPDLRYPKLPRSHTYGKGEKFRGYRFVQDFGLGEEGGSNLDFSDCVLTGVRYELDVDDAKGTVEIAWTIQYNGEELQDDALYGRCAGLATVGKGHVQIIAPPVLTLVKGKGYRSGKPDTPQSQTDDGQQRDLGSTGSDDGTGGDEDGQDGDGGADNRSAEEIFVTDSKAVR